MKSQIVKKDMFEVHKPSGQISSKLTKNGELYQLTPVQFDTINFMCYKAREQMHMKFENEEGLQKELSNFETDEDLFNFLSNQQFTVNLNKIAEFTNSYNSPKDKTRLSNSIKELKNITVEMGLFKKHDLMVEHSFSLIRRYERKTNSLNITYRLEPEILVGWIFKTKPFTKLFLKIQTHLKNTYTKILYENLKDYEKLGEIKKPLKLWSYILGIKSKSTLYVSTMKRDYLNKAMKEINSTTDIYIDKIIGSKENGQQFMTILFHSQDCQLIKDFNEPELSIEEQILYNKKLSIAKERLEKSKQFNKIENEDSWLKKTIESITDDFIKKQDEISESKEALDEIDIKDYIDSLQKKYGDFIGLDDKYRLFYIYTDEIITKNALETYNVLKEIDD